MQIKRIIMNLKTSDLKESKQEKMQLKMMKGRRKMRLSFKERLIAYKMD